mmetsp:Transcript_4626/g.10197  ORF Transcript_4626/g.10197 Transcript_4626/m.10197 type:complete len:158 (-) Transcript_4626:220-693(-)
MVKNFVLVSISLSALSALKSTGAWTVKPNFQVRSPCSSSTELDAAPSSALHYRMNDDRHGVLADFPSSALFSTANRVTSSRNDAASDDLDMEAQLEAALDYAREMDRKHGLCSAASTRAWQVVDVLYLASSASIEVEANVKQVFGIEKSIWSLYERS